jgi:hypothetical protein
MHCEGGPTTTERPAWYDAKAGCTTMLADFLLLELVNSTVQDVSHKHQVSYDLMRGLLQRHVRGEVDRSQFTALRQLGLDEIALLKGHGDFVTIVSGLDPQGQPHVLAVLKWRCLKTRLFRIHETVHNVVPALRRKSKRCLDCLPG